MNRRDAIKAASLVAISSAFYRVASAQVYVPVPRKSIDVKFTHGVHSALMPDGSWNLWVRCAPKILDIRLVRLELHVAEDAEFNLIISKSVHVARREASYIVRTNFAPKDNNLELFFRFVALDSGLKENPNAVLSSAVGKLTNA